MSLQTFGCWQASSASDGGGRCADRYRAAVAQAGTRRGDDIQERAEVCPSEADFDSIGSDVEGQASLREAIRIAQAQRAKSLELRAARDLAWLWGEQSRRAEARDLLTPVYGWFTEGLDTGDLKDAKALLDALT